MGKGAVLDLTAATTGTATGTGARSSADRQSTVSDRHDHYPEQSIRSAQEGNIGSGGRGKNNFISCILSLHPRSAVLKDD